MMWYYLVEGSYDNSDSSEAITIQSLIFRKPRNSAKTHIVSHYKIDIKLFYIANTDIAIYNRIVYIAHHYLLPYLFNLMQPNF